MYFRFLFFIVLSVGLSGSFSACKRDRVFESDASQFPQITKDSIIFDTVFTSIGTTTEFFKIKNVSNKSLRIDRIELAGGDNSNYRINVDGEPGRLFTSIEILPKDSLYIFVEATIDPNGGNTPLVVEDQIIIETLKKTEEVVLIAWGQDAIYHRPDNFIPGLPPFSILPENAIWTSEKPHVVFGYVVVDSARTLRIEAGTQVHFHNGGGMWVYRGGQLTVDGTPENRVVFQGDRLESFYEDAPGQWDRIWINEGPEQHTIRGALIKNGLIGLQLEPLPFDVLAPVSSNTLVLENTIIQNHSGIGLLARNYRLQATNVVLGDAGTYSLALLGGGNYQMNHVTIANYFAEQPRTEPTFFASNAYEDAEGNIQIRALENLFIQNSIIYGTQDTEFDFEFNDEAPVTVQIENTLVQSKSSLPDEFTNAYRNVDPSFKNPQQNDFDLKVGSFAADKGTPTGTTWDVLGRFRDFNPDLGAYEYKPE